MVPYIYIYCTCLNVHEVLCNNVRTYKVTTCKHIPVSVLCIYDFARYLEHSFLIKYTSRSGYTGQMFAIFPSLPCNLIHLSMIRSITLHRAQGQVWFSHEGFMLESVNHSAIMFKSELLLLQGIQIHHGIVGKDLATTRRNCRTQQRFAEAKQTKKNDQRVSKQYYQRKQMYGYMAYQNMSFNYVGPGAKDLKLRNDPAWYSSFSTASLSQGCLVMFLKVSSSTGLSSW